MRKATTIGDGRAAETTPDQMMSAARWVGMFAQGWANQMDPERFSDHLDPWFQPQVRMIQPSVRPLVGRKAFREEFARPLFDLVPDLRGTVENWAVAGDVIYIELRLEGTVGKRRFTMHTCDRITLRDGKAAERFAYLDPAPLIKAVARSPRVWPRFLRAHLRSRRRPV